MTARQDSEYRLQVARGLLEKARQAAARGDWREAALFGRGAVENAAKAIVACFTAVPRSHEPAQILAEALRMEGFPAALREPAASLLLPWRRYGMQEHVMLSYGDEQNRIDPWSLVDETHAREALGAAETAVGFAERCRQVVFGQSD